MSLATLRAEVLRANLAAHGAEVTVTVSGAEAVECDGIWLTPESIETPPAQEFQRREGRWVLVLRKADVPSAPRGTVVVGAPPNGTSQRWVVEGTAKLEADRLYVLLAPEDR